MPPPLLLVHDDLATIASVRKALIRAGRTVQLATSISDALSAFDNLAPEAVLLAPAVEGGTGARFLRELRGRPAGAVTPVLLVGDPVAGWDLPVVRLPVDPARLLEALDAALAPEAEDLPLLDAGHMEELPPLVDAALAQAEADLEAEVFAGLRAPAMDLETWPPAEPAAPTGAGAEEAARAATAEARREAAEVAAHAAADEAARREAEEARARAEAAEQAQKEAEEARARAEEALRTTRRSEAEERLRRTEAEARARLEAEEARRLEAEARAAQAEVEAVRARAEAAQAEAEKAQAQGSAEAELLASALREEAARRTRELAAQEQLRSEAEARAEREARARAEAEARAAAEVARLAREAQERQEAEQRARAEAEARATREREALAQAEREALAQAERAREQAHALEVEAAQLAERLAQGERAALEALARAEEALRRERAAAESLRDELAAARAVAAQPRAPPPEERAPAPRRPAPTPPLVRAPEPRPPAAPAPPVGARSPVAPAARLEWGAADGGRVTLEQLAALVLRLVQVRATARLELRAGETLRILWLSEGELVAAASTHPAESLLQRAVTDGLLDAATGAEARGLRLPDEALAAELVESGALRDAEVLPLLQRLTESRAVEALCEQDTTYLLSTDATPPTEGCAAVRPLAALLAEALHRGLSAEEVPARLHDPRAAPRPLRPGDLARFELSDRERRLLSAVDGERTVRELLTRAGVRQEEGLLGLWVAEVLGLLEVPVPEGERPPEPSPDLELRRLEAKWAAAMEADYFSVLGLPRTAGTDEVRRAHARLAREFDPLRYAGHSDPEVPARAARLSSLLDEAAQALSDERLRAAYARSLVDAEGGTHAS